MSFHAAMQESASTTSVWLTGATGLVGNSVLTELAADPAFGPIVALARRQLSSVPARVEQRIVDFDALEAALSGEKVDVAICCLGTTIKVAGSQEAFRRVDFDYVLAFANAAKAAGATRFLVITAVGADPRSLVFYNRVKGEAEEALRGLGFESLVIARPSLLIGERSEVRVSERLAAPLSRLLPKSLRGIEGSTVARALVRLAKDAGRGSRVVSSGELQDIGA